MSCFVPHRLKDGERAPVVVILHGYMVVSPRAYLGMIEHLTFQGYPVVFPAYNLVNPFKAVSDTDQDVMMERAIRNAGRGLDMLGDKADTGDVTIFGHSLGALLAVCWEASGGTGVKTLVLANISTDPDRGMPWPARKLVRIRKIDWREKARSVKESVLILTGDQDSISGIPHSREIYGHLPNAASKVIYCLQGDDHGRPPLRAGHTACLSFRGALPAHLVKIPGGGNVALDAADYRFYWSALDAAVRNRSNLRFDMGRWSDGTRVKKVLQITPEEEGPRPGQGPFCR